MILTWGWSRRLIASNVCATRQVREKPVSMVRWLLMVWYLMSIWGCAHAVVQPDAQERSAIAFAQKVLKEMSLGLEKFRASLESTLQEKGTYRIFATDFFPREVTTDNMMQNFAS